MATRTRTPVSRRDRPAKPPLSREWIVTTALRVMRADGLERVTMRRLADELDTGPASLYVYVANVAELHGAMLDELLAETTFPNPDPDRSWRDQLVDLLVTYTDVLFGQPSLARSVLTLRPVGPNYLRLVDRALGLLAEGGVPQRQAAWGVDILLLQATAVAAEQGTRQESADTEREDDSLALALREASAKDYPNIVAVGGDLVSGTGPQRQRWALGVLIDGIASTPTPTS